MCFVLPKVEKMMDTTEDTSEDNLRTSALRSALARGSKDMKTIFEKRSKQLKVSLPPSSDLLQRSHLKASLFSILLEKNLYVDLR